MDIARVLTGKSVGIVTIDPTHSVRAAAQAMTQHRSSAALVVDRRGVLLGIVTERDIVRMVGEHGKSVIHQPVSDIMTRTLRTCRPEDSVDTVLALMNEHRIRHMPVLDEGRLLAVLSVGDLVAACVEAHTDDASAIRYFNRFRVAPTDDALQHRMMIDR